MFRRAAGILVSGALSVTVGVGFSTGEEKKKNSAFVFVKPHANTKASQDLVKKTLGERGITIKSEGELTAAQIDKGMLIDQH